jgi:FlaA1/EpsC-like NDP-sugar epimerase
VPSATSEQRSVILNRLAKLPILVKTVPSFTDLMSGNAQLNNVSEVEIGDLLGRDMVPPIDELISASVESKAVLVTGAGGTIGSEICRKIVKLKPKRLVLYDNSEFALYAVEKQLRSLGIEGELVFLLGSIMHKSHLDSVIREFQIETIYHAAAFKHVPMVESNIIEGVRNNVVGTWNVVDSAARHNVEELVLISSDKAVRPTNVMGATKRLAELIVQAYASNFPGLKYSMVRFGNVLRSSGSVVPLFEDQIMKGGPVTVTHKDATRFFMTASEAAELVIQAGAMANGGELYVLDMGESVSINELATKMIHLHGYQVMGSSDDLSSLERQKIEVEYVGLRAGEKLFEELIIGESVSGTLHPKIMMAVEEKLPFDTLISICEQLRTACSDSDYLTIRKILEENVSGFTLHATNTDPLLKMTLERRMGTITPFKKNDN